MNFFESWQWPGLNIALFFMIFLRKMPVARVKAYCRHEWVK